jgi:hypothetical protein
MATGDPWVFTQQRESTPAMTIAAPPNSDISLHCGDSEMLRIAKDGFYVRGVKLEQDGTEINQVYNCFKEWLTWSTMNRV